MARVIPILCFVILTTTCLPSQVIFSGHLYDLTGNPVFLATVIVTDCKDNQIIAFANSDEQGAYRVSFLTDCDSIAITVRALGYQEQVRQLALHRDSVEQDFRLNTAALPEVTIRAQLAPIVQHRDTTEYNVASFTDSTEFSVEDILKKLPGIRVAENGTISFNGKPVERVLLDGDDLTGSQYTIVTRNVRADMISRVQAIERYQENPLLSAVDNSDRVVLNLKIKDDKRRQLSGSVTCGPGYGQEMKGSVHTNLFSLTERNKTYLIGNFNNVGENPVGSVANFSGDNLIRRNAGQNLQARLINTRSPVALPRLSSLPLPDAYTRLNRTGLLFIGQVAPLSSFFKIKASGWLTRDRLEQQTSAETTFRTLNTSFQIGEDQLSVLNPRQYTVQLESTYLPSNQRHALRSFARLHYEPGHALLTLNRSATDVPLLQISQRVTASPLDWMAAAEYTFSRTSHTVWQITGRLAGYHNPARLYAQYPVYPSFFSLDTSFIHLDQPVDLYQNRGIINGKLWSTRWNTRWKLEAGLDWELNNLEAIAHLENGLGEQRPTGAGFENLIRLQAPTFYGRWSADRSWRRLRMFAEIKGFCMPARWQTASPTVHRTTLQGIEPLVLFEYDFNEKNTISTGYRSRMERSPWINMHEAYLFSSYQAASRGLPEIFLLPTRRVSFDYYYRDRPKQFFIHIGGSAQHEPRGVGDQYEISPYLQLSALFRPVTSFTYALNASGSRFFPGLNMLFDVDMSILTHQQQAQVNGSSLLPLATRRYILSGRCGSAFDGWVNFNLFHQWSRSLAAQPDGLFAADTHFSTLQLTVQPTTRFYAKLYLYQAINYTELDRQKPWHATRAEVALKLPALHSNVYVQTVNLFASRNYTSVYNDFLTQNRQEIAATPAFFLVKWEYSF